MHRIRKGWSFPSKCALVLTALAGAGCEAVTEPPGAVVVEALSETALTGVVGREVLPVPAVRIVDEGGSPVGGVSVVFRVRSDRGTVEAPRVHSDADGRASVGRWTVTAPGTQTLAAYVGQSRVLFTVEAEPWRGITKEGGDLQAGAPGNVLPLQLRVAVSEGEDAWELPGAPVTFTVVSGGGSIEGGSATTDSNGNAESGAWTLGPEEGLQKVLAESGSASVVFIAYAIQP